MKIKRKKSKKVLKNLKNETVYSKNLETLQKTDPKLAERVTHAQVSDDYKLFAQGQFPKNVLFVSDDVPFYNNANPLYDTKKELDDLDLKNSKIALFLGMGLGYELFYFSQEIVPKVGTRYVCVVEKDLSLFKLSMMVNDLTQFFLNPNIFFFIGEKIEDLFLRFVEFMAHDQKFVFLKAIKPVYHSSSIKLNKQYYIDALREFKSAAINKIMDFGNSPPDSLVGIENMLSNLDEIVNHPGIILLKDKFKGKPAVVASTGPSLDKNKHLLKGLEDKVLITAPEASLKPLLKIGIKPHLITSLERVLPVIDLIKGVKKAEVDDVYFAAAPVIDREVYKEYPGKRLIVYRNLDHFKWLGIDKGILDIKVTAGNMAFKICEYLGCDPIILIGQDLAHSKDGLTHATGFALSEDGTASKAEQFSIKQLIPVKGNVEETVMTTSVWINAIKAYRRDIAAYKGKCVNSTEGGAYIEGTEIMPFQDAIDKYINKKFYPLRKIKEYLSVFKPDQAEHDLQKVFHLIKSTEDDIDFIVDNYKQQFEKLNEKKPVLMNALNNEQAFNAIKPEIKTLDTYFFQHKNQIMLKKRKTIQLFLAHVFQSVNIQNMIAYYDIPNHYDDLDKAKIAQILWNEKWYTDMINIISVAKESLIRAGDMLKSGTWERSQLNVEFHRGQMEPSEFKRLFPDYD